MTRHRADPRSPATIPVIFVHGMLSGVAARGEPVAPYLQHAGIGPELLQEPGARVTAEQYVALFRSLTDGRDDTMLGLLSRPLRRGSLALIVRAAASAPNLDVAMRRASQAFNLLQDDVRIEPVSEAGLSGWALRLTDPQRHWPHFLHEILLRVFWRLLAWAGGGRLPAARFDFAFSAPPYVGAYAAVFPADLRFDCRDSALWFVRDALRVPVRRDETAVREFLSQSQAQVILPQADGETVSTRVRTLLQDTQPQWPGLAECAQALHLSPATLQRHLAREGISFQALKDALRRDLAIHRLHTRRVSVASLASELGFADSASFQRAFKKWTGSAPGPYRRGE